MTDVEKFFRFVYQLALLWLVVICASVAVVLISECLVRWW